MSTIAIPADPSRSMVRNPPPPFATVTEIDCAERVHELEPAPHDAHEPPTKGGVRSLERTGRPVGDALRPPARTTDDFDAILARDVAVRWRHRVGLRCS